MAALIFLTPFSPAMNTENLSLLLTDDHAMVRNGMIRLFEKLRPSWKFFEAANGLEVLEILKSHTIDIVILDISMKEMDGLQTLAELKKNYPLIKVLMYSMHSGNEVIRKVLESKADGFLTKLSGGEEITKAVDIVWKGGHYMAPEIQSKIDQGLLPMQKVMKLKDADLTARELDVLKQIELPVPEIALKLHITESTVRNHITALKEKTLSQSLIALLRFARHNGVLPTDTH